MKSKTYDPTMPFISRVVIGYYRVHRRCYLSDNFVLGHIACKFLSAFNQLAIQSIFHCVLSKEADIGKNFMMPHPFGVLISPHSKIGDNVKIMHDVTIGHNELSDSETGPMIIGDNVYIAPGAKILAPRITIGEGAVIGPNSVVVKDVPAGAIMFGIPARNTAQVVGTESNHRCLV
jgi:serine O-acetyltransferase